MRALDQAAQIIRWGLVALLLASCSAGTNAQRLGVGIGLTRIHQKGNTSPPPPVSGVTYDTSIGLSVDASGFASLPLNTGASRYYVNSSTGSDSNSCATAKNPATPKATLSSGLSCLVSGNGDQLLVAQGTGGYTWPNYAVVSGFSAQYPTVIESYDPADPTNEAKLGRAADPNRPVVTNTSFHIVGGTGDNRNYIAIRGFEFNPGNIVDAGVVNTANGSGTSNYLLFENDVFAYTALSFDMLANNTLRAQHIIVRNSSSYGQWGNSLSDHAQGLYAAGVDGLTVEDSVFWHNGWNVSATRASDPTVGGPTEFNHPIYLQDTSVRTMIRRNVFIDSSADAGEMKGGGIYQGNLSLSNPIGGWFGSGNNYSVHSPFGVYADGSYNAFVGGGWGYETIDVRQGCNCGVHHNAFAHSDTSLGYAAYGLMADDSADGSSISLPTYPVFDHNVLYQWGSPDQAVHFSSSGADISLIHSTYTNNSWGDASSGSNVNDTSATFANAYTMSSLLSALGYPDLTTAQTAWTANPQLHGWENGPALMLAGYGITVPSLSDLTTVTAFTSGVATTGQFIGTHDGSTITATGLPTCMTIFSDGRGWSEDGTCTTGTVTSTITETNGANVHNTTLTWTIGAQPVLSGLSVTPGSTSATVNVSSNTGSGTIFAEAVSTSTAPSWPQVRGGLNSTDGLNVSTLWPHTSQSVTATGAQPAMSITGLTASTAYYLQIAQLDANNNPSVTSTYAFTTEAAGVATLTSPSGTATGSSSATLSVSSDTASGTLYDIASTSSTAPSVAQIQAGDDSSGSLSAYHTSQTVTATGTQTSSATGLTASTTYYPYFQQHTTAGDSVVVAGASFTTSSGGPPATNIALDFTHLDSSHLFQDTSCTTPVTADLQTAKCIKDTTTGIVATNSTGWVYHANSGKPYLQMDGSQFLTTTSVTFADGTGAYAAWVTASLQTNASNQSIIGLASGLGDLMHPNTTTGANNTFVRSTTGTQLGGAWTTGAVANTPLVFGSFATSTTLEADVNDAHSGGTGIVSWTGTPATAGNVAIGAASFGPFYGMLLAKGDQTSNRTGMETYMAALHP
jgi:hypothetical protein